MGMKVVPPDGGYGWAVLFAAVMINMLLPGSVKSFGVLYVEFLKVLSATPTEASWIPALCYFLYNSLGPVSSMLSSKFSYRLVAIVGCIVSSAGLMLSYFADSVAYLYVSYGVMMGIGCGLSFPVTIYIVCEYFEKRRGFATGLCICGSAIGTIILPPLLQFLLNRLGHKFAVLILGGVLTSTIFCAFLFEPVEKHTKLVAFDDEESDESAKAGKESAGLYDTSRRGSIATVESLTLDPRRISVSLQQVHLRQSFLDKQSQLPKSLAVAESQQIEPKPQLIYIYRAERRGGRSRASRASRGRPGRGDGGAERRSGKKQLVRSGHPEGSAVPGDPDLELGGGHQQHQLHDTAAGVRRGGGPQSGVGGAAAVDRLGPRPDRPGRGGLAQRHLPPAQALLLRGGPGPERPRARPAAAAQRGLPLPGLPRGGLRPRLGPLHRHDGRHNGRHARAREAGLLLRHLALRQRHTAAGRAPDLQRGLRADRLLPAHLSHPGHDRPVRHDALGFLADTHQAQELGQTLGHDEGLQARATR
ncbi:uncharacterized protein LOC106653146 isoform X1 [Trichogramma pretiosum]|uniref:uncharacterized protein LOC106653146 isoform X1 n=1 Tax=Trichogramma pretiosum TaxID=7493 RepID=UPI0006C9551B|nr:uncharacterized protein LOC106653146 isoform X1 [Trichogramma pretiosum]